MVSSPRLHRNLEDRVGRLERRVGFLLISLAILVGIHTGAC